MLSFAIQNCRFKLQQVLDICSLANRAYIKERDKLYLTRGIVVELIQALKFRITLPDENLILLVQVICFFNSQSDRKNFNSSLFVLIWEAPLVLLP